MAACSHGVAPRPDGSAADNKLWLFKPAMPEPIPFSIAHFKFVGSKHHRRMVCAMFRNLSDTVMHNQWRHFA
jgi:hypothetical protein